MRQMEGGRPTLVGAFVALAMMAGVCLSCSGRHHGLPVGSSLPRFTLRDYRSREYKSSELWGKVVIVVFWKVSAKASVAEIRALDTLYDKYQDQGLAVIGIALDAGKGGKYVKAFAHRFPIKFPLLIGSVDTAHLFGGIWGVPTTFIFDRKGKVRESMEGFQGNDTLEAKIQKLLK
jgi:peroxiredoxin